MPTRMSCSYPSPPCIAKRGSASPFPETETVAATMLWPAPPTVNGIIMGLW